LFSTQVPTPNTSKPAAGYALVGELPSGFDQAAAEALIKTRFEAKTKGDFVKADALEKELSAMGVKLNNRRGHRSWKFEKAE
jgi:cysteinyl-tRNA synthetase